MAQSRIYTLPKSKSNTHLIRYWPYDATDKSAERSSWKYLDFTISRENDEVQVHWIINPHFAYGHLEP